MIFNSKIDGFETPTACLKFFHHVIVEVLVDDGIVCAEGGVGIMGIGLN